MIVQFSVENFRSIKSEQTLTLVKNSAGELEDNFFSSNAPNTPELLKTAVIYGANASGKSNVLKALRCMQQIIVHSAEFKPSSVLPVQPFAFDFQTKSSPTTFELIFIARLPVDDEIKPVRVVYGFSCDHNRVYEEWLSVYPKGREQAWYHRFYNDEIGVYQWQNSSLFKGNKSLWQDSTRGNQLFLSVAAQLNSEQLQPIYESLVGNMPIIISNRIGDEFTKEVCQKNAGKKQQLIEFFQAIGVDVHDIVFRKHRADQLTLPDDLPDEIRQMVLEQFLRDMAVFFVYQDEYDNLIEFELNQESDGTQKLFEFAMLLFDVMENGRTIIIDELNNSLHPKLMQYLVKQFNSKINQGNGQLIFTTHETSALRQDLLRRDQIWFCEKAMDRSTTLYPLTDFHPRKGREDIEEAYLHGRYGALPIVADFKILGSTR